MFGARFSKEVLGLGLALGLATALIEPIGRMVSNGPSWPTVGPRSPSEAVGSHSATYNLQLVPYGIDRGVCDRSAVAADLRDALTPPADVLVGGVIGAKMDTVDQTCVSTVLEFAPDQRHVLWRNGNSGLTYTLIARQTFETDRGIYCREYSAGAAVGGQQQEIRERACRQPGGAWTAMH